MERIHQQENYTNKGDLIVIMKIKDLFDAYEVKEKEIIEAERNMKIQFPYDLKKFYLEVGYGFVKNDAGAINRLIDPLGCADIRLRLDVYEYDPDLEMYETFEEDKLIFFEVNEGVYMSIGLTDGKVYFTDKLIAESLTDFIEKIVNPDYWNEI